MIPTPQRDHFQLGPKFLLGQIVPPIQVSEGGIYLPGQMKPTNIWRVLKMGPAFVNFPEIQVGDHVVPEKEYPIVLDHQRLSLIYEDRIYGVTPAMTNQVESFKLAPKFILAKHVAEEKQTQGGIHIPDGTKKGIVELRSSFWTVVLVGPGLTTYASLRKGDQIAPEKSAKVTLDRQEYSVVHEDWILGSIPASASAA